MNLQNILNELEKVDGDAIERLGHVSRRHVFQNLLKKAVIGGTAAAPVAFGSLLNKAYGDHLTVVYDVLNFALALEYLEAEFYNRGLAMAGLIRSEDRRIFEQIAKHENAHVALLRSALGSFAAPKPTFDFTARGAFPTVFSDYNTFKAVAQAFEDTGVRAYKGQAPRLLPFPDVLTTALQIHSVEARHAARVRYLRGMDDGVMVNDSGMQVMQQGWITRNESGGLPGAIYAGEENVMQAGVDVTMLVNNVSLGMGMGTGISRDNVTEAFDEPLTKEQVLAIVSPFIASGM
ncbi:MAG TPA: ferritin-like domain-containing protein [Spirosoma sp.]|jgi:rubrerythrin|nr:ferritin-like domain-containing protein [Spirosoma sp.]